MTKANPTFGERVENFAGYYDSNKDAAAALGVSESTFYDYRSRAEAPESAQAKKALQKTYSKEHYERKRKPQRRHEQREQRREEERLELDPFDAEELPPPPGGGQARYAYGLTQEMENGGLDPFKDLIESGEEFTVSVGEYNAEGEKVNGYTFTYSDFDDWRDWRSAYFDDLRAVYSSGNSYEIG